MRTDWVRIFLIAESSTTARRHAISPSQPRESDRLADMGSLGGLLLLVALAVMAQFREIRLLIFVSFVVLLGAAPFASAGIVFLTQKSKRPYAIAAEATFVIIKAVVLACLLVLVGTTLGKSQLWPSWLPPGVLTAALLACMFALLAHASRVSKTRELSRLLDAYLVGATALIVLLFSPFEFGAPNPIGIVRYAVEAPHFVDWLVLGAAWTAVGLWLRRREGWAFPRQRRLLETLAVVAMALVILSLYDDGHFVDFGHYTPLVGPAMHAARGGIPMVEAYSQYGLLPWAVHSLAYLVFQPGFGTSAVVVRLLNLALFAVATAILLCASRRRLSALWFFIPALLVAITTHNPGPTGMWNLHALPMTLGGRWLLPASMALLLVAASGRRWMLWASLPLIALAALSSVEILAFTLAPWGFVVTVDSLRERSVRLFAKSVGLALAAIAAAQCAFFVAVYAATGAVVDYGPYFGYFSQIGPSEQSFWGAAFVPYYALWFPITAAYFLVIAGAIYRALLRAPANSMVERLLPVAIVGLGPLSYFFGRPQEGTLNVSCTIFAIVAIASTEAIFVNSRRFGPIGLTLSAVLAMTFTLIIADGFEHFMRPMNDPSRGNYTILRRCLTAEGCQLGAVARNMDLALRTHPLDPRTKVGFYIFDNGKRQRIEEAIALLRRWAPNDREVGVLSDSFPTTYADSDSAIAITAFMATGQWFPWSVSSPINEYSLPAMERIVRRAAETADGRTIIISNSFLHGPWADLTALRPTSDGGPIDASRIARNSYVAGQDFLTALMTSGRERLVPIDQAILTTLAQRCRFKLLEKGNHHSVFRTEDCAKP